MEWLGDEKQSHRAEKRHQADLQSILALTLGIPSTFVSISLLICKLKKTRNLPRIKDSIAWKALSDS